MTPALFPEEVRIARRALGSGLRSLSVFGSCLSAATRAQTSIPDLFAVVDDARAAVLSAGASRAGAAVARLLPPATVALRDGAGRIVAKLNLIEPATLGRVLAHLPDLSVAGRLSKRVEIVHVRDRECAQEIEDALAQAARAIAGAALRELPRQLSVAAFARRCFALSYRAELRPETVSKIMLRFDVFAPLYQERFGGLARILAPGAGLAVVGDCLRDHRPVLRRLRDRFSLAWLLARGRLRSVLRWPKAVLLYRGWAPYIAGKLRRARR